MNPEYTFPDTHISLADGNGGRLMRELIDKLFDRHLKNDLLDTLTDAALIPFALIETELGGERILQELEEGPITPYLLSRIL